MPDFTIRGNPGAIRSKASTTTSKGQLFFDTGDALAKVSVEGWTGRAADHFRDAHDLEPERWTKAGNGFLRAGSALETYAGAVENAQSVARWAADEYARGEQVTQDARAAYDADVSRARDQVANAAAAGQVMTLTIIPFEDPGAAIRDNAVREFESAKSELDGAAHVCADQVRTGCQDAPEEPGWLESGLRFVGGVFEGAGEALWDLATLSPFSAVNMIRDLTSLATGDLTPEELMAKYRLSAETAQGMLDALMDDPVTFGKELGKGLLDWDTWADDPARALGHLAPDAIVAALTAGSGTAATRGVGATDDVVGALSDLSRLDDLADLGRLDDLGDLGRLDELDDLGDLGRLDDLGDLGRLDDLADAGRFDDVPTGPQGTDRLLDDPDLDGWLDDVQSQHPELSRDGIRGIWDYTTDNGYDVMNGELRVPGSSADVAAAEARINATNQGLDELPTYDGLTYRGTNLPDHVLDSIDDTGRLSDPAFTSTSTRADVAEGFMDPGGTNPTRITIEGHTGVDVSPFSAARGEAEILFRGGTEFEVLENFVGPDGVRQLIVREVS
jgi:hypothetical protein